MPAIAGRGYPNRPIVTRSTLADPPVLTTRPPIVVSAVQPRVLLRDSLVGRSAITRGSLVDDPVLITAPPIVNLDVQRRVLHRDQLRARINVVRSSLVDVAVTPTATPGPIVVVGPTPTPAGLAFTARSSLVDVPVATPPPIILIGPAATPVVTQLFISMAPGMADAPITTGPITQPAVVTGGAPTPRGQLFLERGSLVDDPQLITNPPIVVGAARARQLLRDSVVGVAILARSSLVDAVAPTAATPGPIVVTGGTPTPAGGSLVQRSTLADPAVLTTAAPVVQVGAAPRPAGGLAFTARSSLVDVVVTIGPTTVPVVVVGPTPTPVGDVITGRSTLADPPQLTTPPPLVVTAATPRAQPPQPYLARSSYVDVVIPVGTPSPIVIAAGVKAAAAQPQIILRRGSLADPPVLTTPGPIVVAAPVRRLPGLRGVQLLIYPNNTDFQTYTPVPPIRMRGYTAPMVAADGTTSPMVGAAGGTAPMVPMIGDTLP